MSSVPSKVYGDIHLGAYQYPPSGEAYSSIILTFCRLELGRISRRCGHGRRISSPELVK